MKRVIISTARRHTQPDEVSGNVYLVDAETGRVLQRSAMIEPPYRAEDTNPRGGMRGCKGISIREDQIAIANSAAVFRYDPQWNLLGMISHPSCSAIHDIAFQRDTLWVTSARTDVLMQFDLFGELLQHYYLRSPSPALSKLGWRPPILLRDEHIRQGKIDFRNPLTHDQESYDRAHLNSLCFLSNGEMLVSLGQVIGSEQAFLLQLKGRLIRLGLWPLFLSFNRAIGSLLRKPKDLHSNLVVRPGKSLSAVVRISPAGRHTLSLAIPDVSTPSHSLLALPDDTVVYLNTSAGTVLHFDPQPGAVNSTTKVTDGFLRGAARLSENTILLGSKGELIVFELDNQRIASTYRLTDDPNEAVYDIKVLPEHFADLPASFEEHFERSAGCGAAELIKTGRKLQAQDAVGANAEFTDTI